MIPVFLVYKPEDQPTQRWHFQPGRLHSGEMILLEKVTGFKYGEQFKQELMMGGTRARQGLLWLFLRRQHPQIKFEDVGFYDDELVLERDKDEIAAEIEALTDFDGMPEADRAAGLALLNQQLRDAPDAPGKAPAGTPATPAPAVADPGRQAVLEQEPWAQPDPYPAAPGQSYPMTSEPYPTVPAPYPTVPVGAWTHPEGPAA